MGMNMANFLNSASSVVSSEPSFPETIQVSISKSSLPVELCSLPTTVSSFVINCKGLSHYSEAVPLGPSLSNEWKHLLHVCSLQADEALGSQEVQLQIQQQQIEALKTQVQVLQQQQLQLQ
eukprot:g43083.t1